MILAVDIGNTNIVLGLYQGQDLAHHWRIHSNISRTVDDYGHQVCSMIELCFRKTFPPLLRA